jgi:hypothetical protein
LTWRRVLRRCRCHHPAFLPIQKQLPDMCEYLRSFFCVEHGNSQRLPNNQFGSSINTFTT